MGRKGCQTAHYSHSGLAPNEGVPEQEVSPEDSSRQQSIAGCADVAQRLSRVLHWRPDLNTLA